MVLNLFRRLGVQSKVLTMVLLASMLSLLLTGIISYAIGSSVLTKAAMNQLVVLRFSRAEAIKGYFDLLSSNVMAMSEGFLVTDALREFKAGYTKLASSSLTTEQQNGLNSFYKDEFIPKLSKNIEARPAMATYLPQTPEDRYLTYHYTANNPKPGQRQFLDDPGDGSDYSRAHKKYHDRIRRMADLYGLRDIFLVDIDSGSVIYTMVKDVDLGTNLKSGPFADTALAKTYEQVRRSRDPNFVYFSDIEHYKPSYGEPAFFVGTTVFDGDRFIGALIYQINPQSIDDVMTDDRRWVQQGLGKTGESFLVGQDSRFRSSPREFLAHPNEYYQLLSRQGVPRERIDWIKRAGSPVLIQAVRTEAARRSLNDQTGEVEYIDYRGNQAIASYQPIRLGNLDWGLVAKIDKDEALRGVRRLRDTLLLLAAVLIPLLTLLSLALARTFIKPIQRLIQATRSISAGDSTIQVPVDSQDEFGELSQSFNAMASSLRHRDEAIRSQLKENDRLLLNILPARTAERLKRGESSITEQFPSVTVLYADLEGFQAISADLEPERAIALLNEMIGAFDDAAERFGVEKLRSSGSNYVAVCGLSLPRIDDEKRTAELALAMLKVVERLSSKHGLNLSLDIGIHTGALAAGVVGSSRFYYDVWGETITIARAIHSSARQNVIQVTEPLVRALDGLYSFTPLEPIELKGEGLIPIWELQRLDAAIGIPASQVIR
jgi:class 3 adenylate cyclase